MAVMDVWLDLNKFLGVYTLKNFSDIPESPGVYAWYYPLTLPSHSLDEFLSQSSNMTLYDSTCKGHPQGSAIVNFNWLETKIKIEQDLKKSTILNGDLVRTWETLIKESEPKTFTAFLKMLMVSSLLMPPLYIGKTNNLRRRCSEHRLGNGSGTNSFKSRYEEFADKSGSQHKSVEDLIFVCIDTKKLISSSCGDELDQFEFLCEEILKLIARPAFSKV